MQPDTIAHPPTPVRPFPLWIIRAGALTATLLLLVLAMPLVWAALASGLGLLALAALGALGVVLFQALPWSMQKLENRLLKLRKAEAQANPIEQLENEMLRRAGRLQAFRKALATVGGQIESIRTLLEERQHKDPTHVLARQQRALEKLEQFQHGNLHRLDQAQSALEEFGATVDRKKSEWVIAEALNKAMGLLDPQSTDHLIDDLLTDEALRSVQDRFNTVFAELDIQMRSVDAPTRAMVGRHERDRLEALTLSQFSTHRGSP
jgi:hypothetical protein